MHAEGVTQLYRIWLLEFAMEMSCSDREQHNKKLLSQQG